MTLHRRRHRTKPRKEVSFLQMSFFLFVVLALSLLGLWKGWNGALWDRYVVGKIYGTTTIDDTPVTRTIFLLIFNPVLESYGNQKLTQYAGWNDPDVLTTNIRSKLNQASHGYVSYSIAERQEVDGWFPKSDGYQYTDASYLACISGTGPCHSPDIINYQQLFTDYNICSKNVDEVWLWGGPYFGYWEYNPVTYCGKTQFVMGFNYERQLAEALHDFGHRVEFVGNRRVGDGNWQQNEANEWNKFSMITGHCGNVHYPPGTIVGQEEYKYDKTINVSSDCNGYLTYPTGPFVSQSINCFAWGCSQEGYMVWWLTHVPSASGTSVYNNKRIYNNWWKYYAWYDETSAPLPVSSPSPTVPPGFTSLSSSLEASHAAFLFSYGGSTSNFIVDLSTVPDMTWDVYTPFAQGAGSPVTEDNPTKWDKYVCGRTLYWRVWDAFRTLSSDIQSATVNCPTPTSLPTITPKPTFTPTPTPTPTPVPPITFSNITSTNISKTSALISWTTSPAGTSRVAYGTSQLFLSSSTVLDVTLVTTHKVTLSNLRTGRRYYYRVYSKNAAGVEYSSPIYNFKAK